MARVVKEYKDVSEKSCRKGTFVSTSILGTASLPDPNGTLPSSVASAASASANGEVENEAHTSS